MEGIRYLDIRLETNDDKEIYLSINNMFDCYNEKKKDKEYYLSDVFDKDIDFLNSFFQMKQLLFT